MTLSRDRLVQAALTTTKTTSYFTAANKVLVLDILLANTSSNDVTGVTVRAGNGVGAGQTLVPGVTVPANGVYEWQGKHILNAADTITAGADTGAVVGLNVSGVTDV